MPKVHKHCSNLSSSQCCPHGTAWVTHNPNPSNRLLLSTLAAHLSTAAATEALPAPQGTVNPQETRQLAAAGVQTAPASTRGPTLLAGATAAAGVQAAAALQGMGMLLEGHTGCSGSTLEGGGMGGTGVAEAGARRPLIGGPLDPQCG